MRKLFFGGNWKSNNTLAKTQDLVGSLIDKLEFDPAHADVIVAPIYLHLVTTMFTKKHQHVEVAAQNCSQFSYGAYTGEVTAQQLKDINVSWVILGHSERRTLFGQTNEVVAKKLELALKAGLKVIFCFGQTLAERQSNKTIEVVESQLKVILPIVNNWKNIVLAYEPVWAIGTGKVATIEQVDEIHTWIRGWLKKIGQETESTRIIYGGSVNEGNCQDLIKVKDVDGFLVGGASLKPQFAKIVKSKKI